MFRLMEYDRMERNRMIWIEVPLFGLIKNQMERSGMEWYNPSLTIIFIPILFERNEEFTLFVLKYPNNRMESSFRSTPLYFIPVCSIMLCSFNDIQTKSIMLRSFRLYLDIIK